MFRFIRNHTFPIGVDMGDDALKLVQLGSRGKGVVLLIAGGSENWPDGLKPGSGDWQRWAVKTIGEMMSNGKFRGKNIVAEMPSGEVFIDHIKRPKAADGELAEAVFSEVKKKLPFEPDDAIMKYIPAEQDNVVVIANHRGKIDRHLAVYEQANLHVSSMGVWPIALINSYTRFFGRRKSDVEAVVMLLDIEANCTNVVICRHKNLLFARSVPIGTRQLDGAAEDDEMMTRQLLELNACRRYFSSMYKNVQIERTVFLSERAADRNICTTIAERLEMPAQMGDCLAAVEIPVDRDGSRMDRRECQVNWAAAFGLSLWNDR